MLDNLPEIYQQHWVQLWRYLRRRFSPIDDEGLRDIVQDAFLEVVRTPDRFEEALNRGGDDELVRLIRCVAWRKARAAIRQRRPTAVPLVPVSAPPGQHHAWALSRLDTLIREAARRFGHRKQRALKSALEHKLWTGEADLKVALQFQVPREYLNRAKRFVQDALLTLT